MAANVRGGHSASSDGQAGTPWSRASMTGMLDSPPEAAQSYQMTGSRRPVSANGSSQARNHALAPTRCIPSAFFDTSLRPNQHIFNTFDDVLRHKKGAPGTNSTRRPEMRFAKRFYAVTSVLVSTATSCLDSSTCLRPSSDHSGSSSGMEPAFLVKNSFRQL